MRRLAAAALFGVLALAGCQKMEEPGFTTVLPLLVAEDEAGAPLLKEGVWAAPSPDCDYDPNKPASQWPECVRVFVIRDHNFAEGTGGASMPYVMAGGDPRLLQARTAGTADQPVFEYRAVRAAAFDAERRIVRARIWRVGCGAAFTDRPTPSCEPRDKDGLRAMARAWDEDAIEWVWVREAPR